MPSTPDPEPSACESLFGSPIQPPSVLLPVPELPRNGSLFGSPYQSPSAFLSDPELPSDEYLSSSPIPEFSPDENTLPEPNFDVTTFFRSSGGHRISTLLDETPRINFYFGNPPSTQDLLDNVNRNSKIIAAKIIPIEKPKRKDSWRKFKEDQIEFDLLDVMNHLKSRNSRLKVFRDLSPKMKRIFYRMSKRYLKEETERKNKKRQEEAERLKTAKEENARAKAIADEPRMNNFRVGNMQQHGFLFGTQPQPQPQPQPYIPFHSQQQIPLHSQPQIPVPFNMHQQVNPSIYPPVPPDGNSVNGPYGAFDWTEGINGINAMGPFFQPQ
ncbi:hypothetical protein FLAG1_07765 [Fusarium langsethiae]|uniref:Uncharacterized protein n=1 Tax=Fusarium langsethiae TaxID=179993 RepID=A0A0N1J2I4_FUSLA|nr:hypothetical protein FLAG1_07765 [Fusarium langsethiae]GKU05219.1 unnamed protein product [Fusarium langsethiae]GKU19666.1 unnamed protein product [Fusarium langsethiae]